MNYFVQISVNQTVPIKPDFRDKLKRLTGGFSILSGKPGKFFLLTIWEELPRKDSYSEALTFRLFILSFLRYHTCPDDPSSF